MANTILRLKHYRKAFHALSLFTLLALAMQRVDATEFKVGGANGWTVPADPNANTYNQWAEKHRFQIGDSLLFVYPSDKDAVLQVKKEDYESCNTKSPIASFKDGKTSFKFNKNGPYYFISGIPENCQKNEKILVVVMANRSSSPTMESSGASSMLVNAIASIGAFVASSLLLVL